MKEKISKISIKELDDFLNRFQDCEQSIQLEDVTFKKFESGGLIKQETEHESGQDSFQGKRYQLTDLGKYFKDLYRL